MEFYLKQTRLFPEASDHAYEEKELSPPDDVKSMMDKYIEQVAYLARRNTQMWQDGLNSCSLNLNEYNKKYKHHFESSHQFTSLSSRVLNAHLPISISKLTTELMDPEVLVKIFPSTLAYASSRYSGGDNVVLDMDYMYEVSPLLTSGEKRVFRCRRLLHLSSKWVIAELSMRKSSRSPPGDTIRFPSGIVIEDNKSLGGCTVTIVDHWLVKNGSRSPVLASINGAHRLWTCLQRFYLGGYAPDKHIEKFGNKFKPLYYENRVLDLSKRMVHAFCKGITGVRGIDGITEQGWVNDEASDESVRIFTKRSMTWKSSVASVSVVATPSTVSSLVHGRSDIWENLYAFEMGELQCRKWRGQVHRTASIENNCVSVHQIKRPGKSQGFLVEETYSDEPRMIVRAVLDEATYKRLVKEDGEDPNKATLMPFGFVIRPESQGRCTVSVGYQFDTEQFNANEVKTMLFRTLTNLTNALPHA